jgi:hypothetical protein
MKHTIALYATILAFAVSLTGCGSCTLYQRHTADVTDLEPWYLAEVCHEGTPQQTITLVCTSKTRLKVGAKDCR